LKRYLKNIAATLTSGEKKRFTTLIILNLAISIADIISLALLVYIINFYTQPQGSPAPSFLPPWLFNRSSVALILLFFILFSLKNLGAWLVHRAQCNFLSTVAARISQSRLWMYLQNGYENYVEVDSSVHIRRIYFHPIEYCQHILDGIQQIITQITLITLAITAILLFNAQLFLLLLIMLLPPVVVVFYYIKRRLRSVRANTRTTSEKSLQHLQEALAGYVESNIYHKAEFFLQRYVAWQKEFYRYFADFLIVQGTPTRIIEVFALLGLFILIVIGQWYGNSDAIVTVGAFMAAAYKIIPGIVKILNISGQMNSYEYTLQDDAILSIPAKTEVAIREISFNNVSFKYNGKPVLNNLDLQLQPGDFLAITGASGKGKTTMLNLMLGFLTPHNGEVLINGSIAAGEHAHWKNIAYVKQQNFLIHDTILRNIILEETKYDEQRLREVIDRSGLNEFIASDAEGLNKMIAENGKNISGGQRQRIAIARALYKEANLIILDEPFNELDENAEVILLKYFQELAAAGKMIVLITHDSKSVSYCNKKISLDE
jgi:ABC-type bacteriocin/lantibiotic exporter with double-glycine peptidase domain